MRRNEDIFAPYPPKRRSFWWPWIRFAFSWTGIITLLILAILWLSGCATPGEDHVRRLMAYPGFEDAHRVAPGFTVEVLQTIEQLQRERDSAIRFR